MMILANVELGGTWNPHDDRRAEAPKILDFALQQLHALPALA
jgi:hypothetical protein